MKYITQFDKKSTSDDFTKESPTGVQVGVFYK